MAILLFAAAGRAAAVDHTDIWFVPSENGWGVNVVQSDNFLSITFFIYGADGKPTWLTGQMTEIKAIAQGVDGRFTAPSVGRNCREDARFAGVLR